VRERERESESSSSSSSSSAAAARGPFSLFRKRTADGRVSAVRSPAADVQFAVDVRPPSTTTTPPPPGHVRGFPS